MNYWFSAETPQVSNTIITTHERNVCQFGAPRYTWNPPEPAKVKGKLRFLIRGMCH